MAPPHHRHRQTKEWEKKKKERSSSDVPTPGSFFLCFFSFLTFLLHRHNLDGGVKQTPKHSFRCDSKRRTSNTSATSVPAPREKKKRLASHQSNTISDLLTFKHIQKDNRIIYDVVPRDIIRSIRNQTQKHFYLLSAWQTGFAWTIMEPLFDLFFMYRSTNSTASLNQKLVCSRGRPTTWFAILY